MQYHNNFITHSECCISLKTSVLLLCLEYTVALTGSMVFSKHYDSTYS